MQIFDTTVNVLRYQEINKHGQTRCFSWVTDVPLTRETVLDIMRIGRRRGAMENETFQTLNGWNRLSF